MTKHGVQSKRNLKTVQLMMLYIFKFNPCNTRIFQLINQIQYLLMNDTICDKQRHTGTARKRLYVHANTGCK
ncbi:hypothetical protein T12_15140, partial [Trichinella patagoniensis]